MVMHRHLLVALAEVPCLYLNTLKRCVVLERELLMRSVIIQLCGQMNPPFDRKSFMFKHGVAVAPKNKDSPNGKKGAGSKKGNSKTESPPTICKAVQAGEDAFFLRHDAMGVADGVGGWSTVKSEH